MERHRKDATMPDSATLNVQPRQRRDVYEGLARQPAGRSVKDMLDDFPIPEIELRETLRKLDRAGLVRRTKGTWCAIPIEPADEAPPNGDVG
jgi:hypothetical protein